MSEGKEISANEFTNVKDIIGNFLYSRDGKLFCYLRVFPYNLDLLSKEERASITNNLASAFGADNKDFAYMSFPREIDLDDYKNFLKDQYQSELVDIGRRKLLAIMIKEAIILSTNGENYEHHHFIKLWKRIGRNLNDVKFELSTRAEEFKERYAMVGIQTELLNEEGIIKLCNIYGNSNQAAYDLVDTNTLYSAIPQIRG